MADRIDPMAPWFSMEDLQSGERLKDSRVTNPPAYESAQIQPRQGQIITVRYTAMDMNPYEDTTPFHKGNRAYVASQCSGTPYTCPTAADVTTLLGAGVPLPVGSRLVKLTIKGFRNDSNNVCNVQIERVLPDGSLTGVLGGDLTTTGSAAEETFSADHATQPDNSYNVLVQLGIKIGDAYDDARFYWADLTYILPSINSADAG